MDRFFERGAAALNGEIPAIENTLGSLVLPQESQHLGLLIETLKYKDPYTFYHSKRVSSYSLVIAMSMGLNPKECVETALAGLIHDIGKLGTPDRVLKKPGRLTTDEFLIMKAHALHSEEMLGKIQGFESIIKSVRHHHERMDGYGYPDGLKGESIPLAARVILVADTYDAMTSDRPYRRGCQPRIAFEELKNCCGTQFDPHVVDGFIRGMERISREELHGIEDFVSQICRS